MVTNPDTLIALQSEWDGVIKMRDRLKLLLMTTFTGGAMTAPALANVVYNLPVLLAYDVLSQVLLAGRDEGVFASPRTQLGHLMDSAKDAVSWINWDNLRAGVRRRNEIAHDGKLFD